MKIDENCLITLENDRKLILQEKVNGVFVAINRSNLLDPYKYIVESYTRDNGDKCIHIMRRLDKDSSIEKQIEKALRDRDIEDEIIDIPLPSSNEEIIISKIADALDEEEMGYSFDKNTVSLFTVPFDEGGINLVMTIQYLFGVISLNVGCPYEIAPEYSGIAAIYVCEHNEKSLAKWEFDISEGILCMGFELFIDDPQFFDVSAFRKRLRLVYESVVDELDIIKLLSEGRLSKEREVRYFKLMMDSLISMKKGGKDCVQQEMKDDKKTRAEVEKYLDRIAKGEIPTPEEFFAKKIRENAIKEKVLTLKLPFEDAL